VDGEIISQDWKVVLPAINWHSKGVLHAMSHMSLLHLRDPWSLLRLRTFFHCHPRSCQLNTPVGRMAPSWVMQVDNPSENRDKRTDRRHGRVDKEFFVHVLERTSKIGWEAVEGSDLARARNREQWMGSTPFWNYSKICFSRNNQTTGFSDITSSIKMPHSISLQTEQ
jgi:hypothetical protein